MSDLRVLFFGDSFVAGVGDPHGHGWVGRAVAAAYAAGWPLTAYALGVRGETSAQVATRLRAETAPRLAADCDVRLVLAVGANDTTLEAGGQRVEMKASCAALGRMLDDAAALGLAVAVAGPPPIGDPAQQARVMALSAAYGELCASRGVPFWPVSEPLLASGVWLQEAVAGDGAHPGAGGYELLARLLLDGGLLAWLQAPRLPAAMPGA